MFSLVFYLLLSKTKWQHWILSSAFALYVFMKPCQMAIKILLALQQDVRKYAGNLIYGVRLQVNVMWEIDWLKISLSALLHCSGKKKSFMSDGHFRESSLNFNFSIASTKSNYDNISSFLNKLKFDDSDICTKLLIREWKIINNCPSNHGTIIRTGVTCKKILLWNSDEFGIPLK